MKFNNCEHCGAIRENATLKLNRLKKKIDERMFSLTYGFADEKARSQPTKDDLWLWAEEIKQILGEL